MGSSALSLEQAKVTGTSGIQYYETAGGLKGYAFWNENGNPQGYRVTFQSQSESTPILAEKLNVTSLSANRVSYTDTDGARVSILPDVNGASPEVIIDGELSKNRYSDESKNEGAPEIVKKIQAGEITKVNPSSAGVRHNPSLGAIESTFTGPHGNTYALLGKQGVLPSNGDAMELAIISPNGQVRFFSGQASNCSRGGYTLNTEAGSLQRQSIGPSYLGVENLTPNSSQLLNAAVLEKINAGAQSTSALGTSVKLNGKSPSALMPKH